jgi:hypothetical protein
MPELDLGHLLRLKGSIEAAASSVKPDGSGAPALTESYMRLRSQVQQLIGESSLSGEFESTFPVIEIVDKPMDHPRAAARAVMVHEAAAQEAKGLLGQLAGWLDGLIAEQTLEQRLRFEAEARVKEERRKPPGFTTAA